ncbi:MAG: alpha-amylase family protein [Clostridiaceae bacterium]
MNFNQLYSEPMRIGAVQWEQGDRMFEIPEILSDGGFNVEQLLHVVGDGVMGLFDAERDAKNLKNYIRKSNELGTKIILYFNAHMIETDTYGKRPEWAQRHKNGEYISAYDTYVLACVNSTWRDDFMGKVACTLDYGIEGIFLDGPIFFRTGCYCNACREKFKAAYEHDMDIATDAELREFKTNSIADFVKDVKCIIDRHGGNEILYANSTGLAPNVTGCDIDGIYPYVDFIGTEGGFMFYKNPNEVSLWKCSKSAKYLESKAKGKPTVIFSAAHHSPWARCIHTPQESKLLMASTVANGANLWYGIHGPIELSLTPGCKAVFEFNRFLAENAEYYNKTKSNADAAIVWSKNTIHAFPEDVDESDFTQKEKRNSKYEFGSFSDEFEGFCDIMTRNHTQFTIIDDKCINEDDLSRFNMIVLPNVSCLSEKECTRIREYVQNGGTIISTLATSFFDECGNVRNMPLLADVFGIDAVEGTFKYKNGCTYMELEGSDRIKAGLSSAITSGCHKSVKCKFREDSTVLACMYYPMAGSYEKFPTKKYPSIVLSNYGKGKSIYISGGIGETYFNYGMNDLKKLIKNILSEYNESSFAVENAYETVEVEMRVQNDCNRALIHFVNYTGCMQRPIDKVIPCSDIKVLLKSDKEISEIYTAYSRKKLEYSVCDNYIEFTVPLVNEYELAVIQFKLCEN